MYIYIYIYINIYMYIGRAAGVLCIIRLFVYVLLSSRII